MNRGFTLAELLICVAIFIFMTALVVAKYGNFNQSTLLTDTAYDVALVLRTAQTYGLSVKDVNGNSSGFDYAYGVDFNDGSPAGSCGAEENSSASQFILFADTLTGSGNDHICTLGDTFVSAYAITRGATISCLYVGSGPGTCIPGSNSVNVIDVTYRRPNPDATICANDSCLTTYPYGQVTIKGSDGSLRSVGFYQNGQIAVNE